MLIFSNFQSTPIAICFASERAELIRTDQHNNSPGWHTGKIYQPLAVRRVSSSHRHHCARWAGPPFVMRSSLHLAVTFAQYTLPACFRVPCRMEIYTTKENTMSQKSQDLIFQLAEHISLLHRDQADILDYTGKLERLLEDYRTFISPLDFPTEPDKQRQHTVLLQHTRELLGEAHPSTPKEDPGVTTSGLYRFEIDRDEAEKKQRRGN